MDFEADARLTSPPDAVAAAVADLSTYPSWFSIVRRAVADDDGGWVVDIGAKVGFVSTTKRVRMVRVAGAGTSDVRFERRELDGREHSAWVLQATVAPDGGGDGTKLTVHLHYGGLAWIPGLDLVLRNEARHAGKRLDRLLFSGG